MHDTRIIALQETTSTNDYLKTQPCSGSHEILVATAQFQTAGRGQSGAWISQRGLNLVFSLRVQPQALRASEGFILSQANALALRETVASVLPTGIPVMIKWPNDIYVCDMKIAGTLIENALTGKDIQHSVIGTGLNVNQTDFPDGLAAPATSLRLLLSAHTGTEHGELDCDSLLHTFVQRFSHYYAQVLSRQWDDIRRSYHESLYLSGQRATFRDAFGTYSGCIRRVLPDGHLVIEDEEGKERIYGFKEVKLMHNGNG